MQHHSETLGWSLTLALPECCLLTYARHISHITKICGLLLLIVITVDKSRGYTGFTSIVPPLYILLCVRITQKNFHKLYSNLAHTFLFGKLF